MASNRIRSVFLLSVAGALLAIAGCGGSDSGTASVPPSPATVLVSLSPATITVGMSSTLSWSSNAVNCTATGAWTGGKPNSGTQVLTPAAAGVQQFTLACSDGMFSSNTQSGTLTTNPASAFSQTALVSNVTGTVALRTDANLVNPWGIVMTGTAPVWISNNRTQTSTLYDGAGVARATVVSFAASPTGAPFGPTGIVGNTATPNFAITSAGKTAAPNFIFSGEGGMIAGWSPTVDATHGIAMYTDAAGAVYKGLAIATNAGQPYLYATDFKNAKVDVFNGSYVRQTRSATVFTFADPSIPAGYAPYGIQAVANGTGGATQIYVSYARQLAPANVVESAGPGQGYVDIYDTNGQLIKQLIAGGALNAPWGLAVAPTDFGTLGKTLLVGNFGDGRINGYDAATGVFIGSINNAAGVPLTAFGLWGMAFGNDANNQPHQTLFYAAGSNGQAGGTYGRIDLGATPPVIGGTPTLTLAVPASPLRATVALTATITSAGTIAKVDYYAGTLLVGTVTASPYTLNWDTTKVANGSYGVRAVATDSAGNVGSSAVTTVTVTQ